MGFPFLFSNPVSLQCEDFKLKSHTVEVTVAAALVSASRNLHCSCMPITLCPSIWPHYGCLPLQLQPQFSFHRPIHFFLVAWGFENKWIVSDKTSIDQNQSIGPFHDSSLMGTIPIILFSPEVDV
jgi:hypothetical protein